MCSRPNTPCLHSHSHPIPRPNPFILVPFIPLQPCLPPLYPCPSPPPPFLPTPPPPPPFPHLLPSAVVTASWMVLLLLQGDRVGICVTQLDASLVERGIACTSGSIPTFTGAIAAVDKIRFFVGQMPSRLKVHVTIGHQTVMGEIQFFGLPEGRRMPQRDALHAVMARMDLLTTQVQSQNSRLVGVGAFWLFEAKCWLCCCRLQHETLLRVCMNGIVVIAGISVTLGLCLVSSLHSCLDCSKSVHVMLVTPAEETTHVV